MDHYKTVIEATKAIEAALKALGGQGLGLHELATSLGAKLSKSQVSQIRFIATIRNNLCHVIGFTETSIPEYFLPVCEQILAELSPQKEQAMPATAGTPRRVNFSAGRSFQRASRIGDPNRKEESPFGKPYTVAAFSEAVGLAPDLGIILASAFLDWMKIGPDTALTPTLKAHLLSELRSDSPPIITLQEFAERQRRSASEMERQLMSIGILARATEGLSEFDIHLYEHEFR